MEVVESPIPPPLPAVTPVKLPTPPPTLERPPRGTCFSLGFTDRFCRRRCQKIRRPPRQGRAQSPPPPRVDPSFDRQFYIPARIQWKLSAHLLTRCQLIRLPLRHA